MNKNKIIQLFVLCATIQLQCIEGDSNLPTKSDEVSLRSAELVLLKKFGAEKLALPIYVALQQCLKGSKEISCRSGFKLFNRMRRIIEERNILMTQEEVDLFEQMEKKYSAGPSYSGIK